MPQPLRPEGGFLGYQRLAQLTAGPDGIVFSARSAFDYQPAEIRQLTRLAVASPSERLRVTRRLNTLQLAQHPGLVSLLVQELDTRLPGIVCQPFYTWPVFDQAHRDAATLLELLDVAVAVAGAIDALHQVGLIHGGLFLGTEPTQAVRITADKHALIDGTRLLLNQPQRPITGLSDHDSRVDEPIVDDDVGQLAHWIAWLFASSSPGILKRLPSQLAPRARAGLLQRVSAAIERDSEERPTAAELLSSLLLLRTAAKRETQDTDLDQTRNIPLPQDSLGGTIISEQGTLDDEAATTLHTPFREPVPGDHIGRFEIERKLGQGGMGAVYLATDRSSGEQVAIKTLLATTAQSAHALRRFRKEARLLAAVNNDYVAKLIEANESNGLNYLVVEYLPGETLKTLLEQCGSIEEPIALGIIADVARALVEAHDLSIVHRDVKPENILLAQPQDVGIPGRRKPITFRNDQPWVKLSDFGLARFIEQTESLEVTRAGAILGTPLYMAPELFKGTGEVAPQVDIYALGATLFELLTGRPPFLSNDLLALASLHAFEPSLPVDRLNPKITSATTSLVAKMLAKRPNERFADARHLLAELERLLGATITNIAVHPKPPAAAPGITRSATYEWNLHATPEQLWPLVSNTERLNRAVGLPAVRYRSVNDPATGLRRFAQSRILGCDLEWEEHPYEWVEGRKMGVLREFTKGPYHWFLSSVELTPLVDGGTHLKQTLTILPRHWIGKLVARIQLKSKAGKLLDQVYRRIDRELSAQHEQGQSTVDPYEHSPPVDRLSRRRLDQRLSLLREVWRFESLTTRLEDFIANGPIQELQKIRSYALADRWQESRDHVTELCLEATSAGLLAMRWDILCPRCRVPSQSLDSLRELANHGNCPACQIQFETDFAQSVELTFRVHPELRTAEEGQYCIGGPWHAPHVIAQLRLDPQERVELETSLPAGDYLLTSPQLPHRWELQVKPSGAPSLASLSLSRGTIGSESLSLRAGHQVLRLTNLTANLIIVKLERTLPRNDVLTAAQATTLATFRNRFPNEVLGTDQSMVTTRVALLASSIFEVEMLYEQLGDSEALQLIREQANVVSSVIRKCRGTVVKWQADQLLAAFHDVADAAKAALALQPAVDQVAACQSISLSVGVHAGEALVTTLNDRLDYFGSTTRITQALPSAAGDRGVILTSEVYIDPAVAELIQPFTWTYSDNRFAGTTCSYGHTSLPKESSPQSNAESS